MMLGFKQTFKKLSNHTSFYLLGCSVLSIFSIFYLTQSFYFNEKKHQKYQEFFHNKIQKTISLEKDIQGLNTFSRNPIVILDDIVKKYPFDFNLLDELPQFTIKDKRLDLKKDIEDYFAQRKEHDQVIIELQNEQKKNQTAWKSLYFIEQQILNNKDFTSHNQEVSKNIENLIENLLAYQSN